MRASEQIKIMAAAGWLSPKEAARRAGISVASMYRLVAKHDIATTKTPDGGALYISAESLAKHYAPMPPIAERIMEGMPEHTSAPPPT